MGVVFFALKFFSLLPKLALRNIFSVILKFPKMAYRFVIYIGLRTNRLKGLLINCSKTGVTVKYELAKHIIVTGDEGSKKKM